MPSRSAAPPLISSTALTGSPEGMGFVDSGIVRSTIRRICPSAPMNSMSRGISVFFIQKATDCSLG